MLRFSQSRYYQFGVKAGLANLFRNGWKLGIRKTLGKIFQPVNFYGRFPEFYFFEQGLEDLWRRAPAGKEVRILDVGSPKLFGMYLAFYYPVQVWLTDIHPLNLDEYRIMWGALSARAAGGVHFDLQDARRLSFPDHAFDGVYAMSVVEHIAGEDGDKAACAEMLRVLRPGGRLVLSVPYGPSYVEQRIVGMKEAVEKVADKKPYFFQRIYDNKRFRERLSGPLQQLLETQRLITVGRCRLPTRVVHWLREKLGENAMGFLGFTNPMQSRICNEPREGMADDVYSHYGPEFRLNHVYADLIWASRKQRQGEDARKEDAVSRPVPDCEE